MLFPSSKQEHQKRSRNYKIAYSALRGKTLRYSNYIFCCRLRFNEDNNKSQVQYDRTRSFVVGKSVSYCSMQVSGKAFSAIISFPFLGINVLKIYFLSSYIACH